MSELSVLGETLKNLSQIIAMMIKNHRVRSADIAKAKEALAMNDALGPILDPTLYRKHLHDGTADRAKANLDMLEAVVTWFEDGLKAEGYDLDTVLGKGISSDE